MTAATMSVPARHVLNVAILRAASERGIELPVDGWEHYFTGLGDDGLGTFAYDRTDGRSLIVRTGGEQGHTIDFERSILEVA